MHTPTLVHLDHPAMSIPLTTFYTGCSPPLVSPRLFPSALRIANSKSRQCPLGQGTLGIAPRMRACTRVSRGWAHLDCQARRLPRDGSRRDSLEPRRSGG